MQSFRLLRVRFRFFLNRIFRRSLRKYRPTVADLRQAEQFQRLLRSMSRAPRFSDYLTSRFSKND